MQGSAVRDSLAEAALPFDHMGSTALSALVTAMVIAFVAALLLDAIYATGMRRALQSQWVHAWLSASFERRKQRAGPPHPSEASQSPRDRAEATVRSLATLGSADDERSLFALRYRQLCGQIAAALQAESALPEEERVRIFSGLAPTLDATWMAKVLHGGPIDPSLTPHGGPPVAPAPTHPAFTPDHQEEQASRLAEAQQLLTLHAERGLDDLQAFLARQWQFVDYVGAFVVAVWLLTMLSSAVGLNTPGALFWLFTFRGQSYLVFTIVAALLVPLMRRAIARLSATLS